MKNNEIFVNNKEKLKFREYQNAWAVKINFGKVEAEFTFPKKDFKSLDDVKKYIFEVEE